MLHPYIFFGKLNLNPLTFTTKPYTITHLTNTLSKTANTVTVKKTLHLIVSYVDNA